MINSKHHVTYCKLCDRDTVVCATCGNNCCNGGRGMVGTIPCPDCNEAWEHNEQYMAQKDSVGFAKRLEPRYGSLNDLIKPLSDEEYAAVPVPTSEEIQTAFRKGQEIFAKAGRAKRRIK